MNSTCSGYKRAVIKPLTKLLLFAVAVLPLSLAADYTGGQDGGGGLGGRSSADQVREAIQTAYQLAARKDSYSNIFVRFWYSYTAGEYVAGETFDPSKLFPKAKAEDVPEIDSSSPALEALLKNPPELLASGDCPQRTRPHADASTSNFELTGKVCFSIERLQRFPPSIILGQVLSLMLHESLHLAGIRDEAVPDKWQEEFEKYFRWRFHSLEDQHIKEKTLAQLGMARSYLNSAININKYRPGDPAVFAVVGALGRLLISLPYLFDPIALELAVHPKNPDLVNNYSNTLLSLYIFGEEQITAHGRHYLQKPKAMAALLNIFMANLEKVSRAFIAYADGAEGGARNRGSHCILADAKRPLELLLETDLYRYSHEGAQSALFIPPLVCDPGTLQEKINSPSSRGN